MIPRFRAWDKEFKEMVQVDALVFEEQIIKVTYKNGNVVKEDLKNYVLMQSTGLKDKNGKEIFEGDIIDSTDGFITGVVEFREALGMFISDLVEYNNFERLCNVASSRKIIGNIWEHPELAEASS
jgi:uncharacterized phage protein (TIGR01671 family)|nr:MAG TPA: YopX protein [Caudoviricetes sp.]